ncbi:MAG: polyketide cyclase [Candidatus Omnitrophica bacterium]|nr:polyketide cyclase [Candidatus Omnitrophota bacterium]
MGHTCNSILINAPYDLVFDISNDIPRWTELFGSEYKKAEILKKEANKITFRLTDDEDKSWVSWRLLFKDNLFTPLEVAPRAAGLLTGFTYSERHEPKFPFEYMKIIWLYTPKPDGVELTWIQHFKMDAQAKFSDEQVEGFINKHSKDNLLIFKKVIETAAGK